MDALLLRLRRRYRSRPLGQSLVEFALILPVFLFLFGTVLDLGRIAAAQVTIENAAREGALQASRTPTDFDATQPCPADARSNLVVCRTVLEARNTGVAIAPGDIAVSCEPTCSSGLGNRVTVAVTGHFRLLTPFLTPFFGGRQDITFAAVETHQVETLPAPPSPAILTSAPPTASPSIAPSSSASASPTPTPSSQACNLPSAGFTYSISPTSRKAPATLTVTDTSTSMSCAINRWYWEFAQVRNDGSSIVLGSSLERNPAPRTYGTAGTYTISLTVWNAAGSSTKAGVIFEVRP